MRGSGSPWLVQKPGIDSTPENIGSIVHKNLIGQIERPLLRGCVVPNDEEKIPGVEPSTVPLPNVPINYPRYINYRYTQGAVEFYFFHIHSSHTHPSYQLELLPISRYLSSGVNCIGVADTVPLRRNSSKHKFDYLLNEHGNFREFLCFCFFTAEALFLWYLLFLVF